MGEKCQLRFIYAKHREQKSICFQVLMIRHLVAHFAGVTLQLAGTDGIAIFFTRVADIS